MSRYRLAALTFATVWLLATLLPCVAADNLGEPLAGTKPLTMEGDLAAQMVAGIDKFLLRELELSVERREKFWKRDVSSPEAYQKSIEPNRQRLAKILGVVDPRVPFDAPELLATTKQSALVGKGENYEIFAVRWPAVRGVNGEGLLLVPKEKTLASVIAIPDADQTPEQLCGIAEGIPPAAQFPRHLAASGIRVLVPTLISREMRKRSPPGQPGRANLTNREFLYRPAFELGRHLIGYELQKVLAGVDWFAGEAGASQPSQKPAIGVIGYGEGGMLALYAAALDPRVTVVCASGSFGLNESLWEQPIDRNVFGLLEQFGDSELAWMCDRVVIEGLNGPTVTLPSEGGGPGRLSASSLLEIGRLHAATGGPKYDASRPHNRSWVFRVSANSRAAAPFANEPALRSFAGEIINSQRFAIERKLPDVVGKIGDSSARQQRQLAEIQLDTQLLLAESPYVRQQFMKKLADCKGVEAYSKVVEEYREIFATQAIGRFDNPLLEPNPRSRKSYDTEKWTGYEVVLDVFPDVFAYGILCLPKDLKPGEKRPVVVCQHGLEGRPQDTIGEQGSAAYSAFAGKLAERGFITFAPQNIYIGKDNFRTLQRKANPLGKTLFSIMVPQHQQIVSWLKSQTFVDGERIAFYGLSYGGKSAMRIPPLVKDYCLSICSADFNDWVDKNASTRGSYSYVWTGEYEIFEWDLGSTFNYAEMAALIAPRPFMVERGHFDGVGVDERVALEYAKVQRIYNVQLGLPDRCAIEYFVGPHKINGVGTFAFLHKHLNWPVPGK
jgi:dienelactone hydrolase